MGNIESSEASGKTISISCDSLIHIDSARYGSNCNGGGSDQTENLRKECDNKQSCFYKIDHNVIGDPAPQCPKQYDFVYSCQSESESEENMNTMNENHQQSMNKMNEMHQNQMNSIKEYHEEK